MSKPIINGIDVSECIFYSENNCDIGYIADSYPKNCKNNPDCYFKQLKRLQEENKRLQMLSCANCGEKYLSPDGSELYEKNVQLQKENEKLKEDINKRTHCISCQRELENCRLSITNAKYKQAFEEIRNITEKLITELPEYNSCYYKDECGDNCTPKQQSKVEYCCYENVDKILTIISEVLKCQQK